MLDSAKSFSACGGNIQRSVNVWKGEYNKQDMKIYDTEEPVASHIS